MSNRMGIPAVRKRMHELADEHDIPELHDLADQTIRRPAQRRAAVRSPKLTPKLAKEIRVFAVENPDLHLQDIAEKFGVNHGRVSEALNNEI